jgi:hypothetical protein
MGAGFCSMVSGWGIACIQPFLARLVKRHIVAERSTVWERCLACEPGNRGRRSWRQPDNNLGAETFQSRQIESAAQAGQRSKCLTYKLFCYCTVDSGQSIT